MKKKKYRNKIRGKERESGNGWRWSKRQKTSRGWGGRGEKTTKDGATRCKGSRGKNNAWKE